VQADSPEEAKAKILERYHEGDLIFCECVDGEEPDHFMLTDEAGEECHLEDETPPDVRKALIPSPPLARAESELFRRRCHVIENWMRLRRNPLLQSRRGDDFAPRPQGRGIGAYRFGGTMPNGTSSDQETREATIAPFYHAIGRATARWQHVEAGLFVLAHAIMQKPDIPGRPC
jgi:hypothetical protein